MTQLMPCIDVELCRVWRARFIQCLVNVIELNLQLPIWIQQQHT